MVNQQFLDNVKSKLNEGGAVTADDTLQLLEVYKQISLEKKELQEEFEDMAMLDMEFLGQIIISDENRKFWLEFKGGKVDFGEGEVEVPTLTFNTTMNVFSGILFGHIEISSAHKAGDVSFEGSGEELMDFQAITSVINDFLQNL
ncbi:MAG: SCP2 sterol-binding domain-containing protein [Candidatus Lokiarchaeota archaeon]|nr:SCP2 sterol-binding domain-containing protein [Candidatus Lokiarchaeota archaeon]